MKTLKKTSAIILALVMIASVFTACSIPFLSPESKLLGAWRDSTGTIGYEFKKDGICSITYGDITVPIINIHWNGTVDGTYSVTKNQDKSYSVTVNYTILSQTLSKTYNFTVDKSALTLVDIEDGSTTVLQAYTPETSTAAAASDTASAG